MLLSYLVLVLVLTCQCPLVIGSDFLPLYAHKERHNVSKPTKKKSSVYTRMYKKACIGKNLLWTVFHKLYKDLLTQQVTELSDFLRESGDFFLR